MTTEAEFRERVRFIVLVDGTKLIAKHITNRPDQYLGECALFEDVRTLGDITWSKDPDHEYDYEMRRYFAPLVDNKELSIPVASILHWQTPN